MMPIPDERDITKAQLWQRIDDSIQTLNTIAGNFADNVNALIPQLHTTIDLKLADFRQEMNERNDTFKRDIKDALNNYENKYENTGTKLSNFSSQKATELDQRLTAIKENIKSEFQKQISDAFKEIANKIDGLNVQITTYKKSTENQMDKLQTDTGEKLGDIAKRFETMKTKFKKITEQLQ